MVSGIGVSRKRLGLTDQWEIAIKVSLKKIADNVLIKNTNQKPYPLSGFQAERQFPLLNMEKVESQRP